MALSKRQLAARKAAKTRAKGGAKPKPKAGKKWTASKRRAAARKAWATRRKGK